MFKIITSLAMFFTALVTSGQVTETRNVSTFNKIEIADGVEVIFTQSPQTSLKAEASDALGLSTLLTQTDGKTLKISCNGNMCESVKVYLSAPEILAIKATSASKVVFTDKIDTRKLNLSLAAGSTFRGIVKSEGAVNLKGKSGSVFNIRVDSKSLSGNFQSGAKVNLSGTSGDVAIHTADDALCNARNFRTENVSVKAGGNSSVQISVKDAIAVDVAGEATVAYFGLPETAVLNPEAVIVSNQRTSVTQN
ncbi:MAG: hypothetical protein EOO48_04950 [Flavobacterium sp.]|nr:MAG: hypothetical protein EOO48_04950 [Flavobacterium sp.]